MSKHCSNLLSFHIGSNNLHLPLDGHENNINTESFENHDKSLLIYSIAVHSKCLALSMLKYTWVCASEVYSYLNYHMNKRRIGPVWDIWMKQGRILKEKQTPQFPNRQHILDICLLGGENRFFFSHVYWVNVTKHLFENQTILTFRFFQCFEVLWLSLTVEIMYLMRLFLNCGRADWWIGQLYVSDSRTPCHWSVCWCNGFATLSLFHKGYQHKYWKSVHDMSGRWGRRSLPPLETC